MVSGPFDFTGSPATSEDTFVYRVSRARNQLERDSKNDW